MAEIGADPDQLRALRGEFDSLGRRLRYSGASIDTLIRGTYWRGRDADLFRSTWSDQHRSTIDQVVATCSSIADLLAAQADEQVAASEDDGPRTTLPTTGEITHAARSSAPPSAPSSAPESGSTVDRSADQSPTPTVRGRVPDEIVSLSLGAEGTIASGVAVSNHRVIIESLGEDRLLTITTRDGVGIRGATGTSISLGSIDVGSSVSGDAVLGVVSRRSFETDAAGVATMIARAEFDGLTDRLDKARRVVPSPLSPLLGPAADLTRFLGEKLGISARPVKTETLLEVAVDGSVAATLPMRMGGRGSLSGLFRVGMAEGRAGRVAVLEAEGGAARAMTTAITGSGSASAHRVPSRLESRSVDPVATYSARLEISTDEGGHRAVLRTDRTEGSAVHRTTTEFRPELSADMASARYLLAAATDLEHGRIGDAIDQVTKLALADGVDTTHSTFRLTTDEKVLGGSAGTGVSFGGKAAVKHTRMVRMDGGH